jgi:hypothetical protein
MLGKGPLKFIWFHSIMSWTEWSVVRKCDRFENSCWYCLMWCLCIPDDWNVLRTNIIQTEIPNIRWFPSGVMMKMEVLAKESTIHDSDRIWIWVWVWIWISRNIEEKSTRGCDCAVSRLYEVHIVMRSNFCTSLKILKRLTLKIHFQHCQWPAKLSDHFYCVLWKYLQTQSDFNAISVLKSISSNLIPLIKQAILQWSKWRKWRTICEK